MPLYEYRKNAENLLPLPEKTRNSITVGSADSCRRLLDELVAKMATGGSGVLLIDGWYGVDWRSLRAGLTEAAGALGRNVVVASTAGLFRHDLAD